MKLETSEEERKDLRGWAAVLRHYFYGDAITGSIPMSSTTAAGINRLLRDFDTLLAEVERLKADRRPFSDGLAQKVIDEQVKTIDRLNAKLAERAPPLPAEVEEVRKAIEAYLAETVNPGETLYEGHPKVLLNQAAALLSRCPGGWRPIKTAPKDGMFLASNGNTVVFASKEPAHEQMCRDQYGYPYVANHWQPIPEPPHE